jgi:hypothetical protein
MMDITGYRIPAMWRRSFLILHGGENRRPAGHWQYDLAQRLRQRCEQVFYPHIPDGYGPCPSVLEWCLDPTARLTVN